MECDLNQQVNTPQQESLTPVGDALDKQCAYWMAIGVPYELFWFGDYTQLKYYKDAHMLKVEQRNQEMWMQGLYFYEAVSVAISNAMKKKGQPPDTYPKEPHRVTPLTEEEKEREKQKMVENFRAQLNALDRKFTAKHAKQKEVAENGC